MSKSEKGEREEEGGGDGRSWREALAFSFTTECQCAARWGGVSLSRLLFIRRCASRGSLLFSLRLLLLLYGMQLIKGERCFLL